MSTNTVIIAAYRGQEDIVKRDQQYLKRVRRRFLVNLVTVQVIKPEITYAMWDYYTNDVLPF